MDADLGSHGHDDGRLHRPGAVGDVLTERQELYAYAVQAFREVNNVRCLSASQYLWIVDRLVAAGLLTLNPLTKNMEPQPAGCRPGRQWSINRKDSQ